MGAFAAYLKRVGIRVTGSDQNIYPPMSDVLKQAGVELYEGYRARNLDQIGEPDLVVIGNVITRVNPEASSVMERGWKFSSLPEYLKNHHLEKTRNLLASGTHGKTTTSSLLAHVLHFSGESPSYFIGGVSHDLPHSFHVVEGSKYFVLEGDEYDTAYWDKVPKFNHYLPDDVIFTSVEYDHADIYPEYEDLLRAFDGLIERIRDGGRLIACADYPLMKRYVEAAKTRKIECITYGSHAMMGADYHPENIATKGEGQIFELMEEGKKVAELEIPMSGMHNLLNAMSVYILCSRLGLESQKISEAFKKFRGVKRRQEVRGEPGGVTVIDDFAHHPTAVRETLKGLKEKYSGRRLIAVFEPRSATSRRAVFQKDYVKALREADEIFLCVPYDQSKISDDDRFSSERLREDLEKKGKSCHLFEKPEDGVEEVKSIVHSGDVVVVMSNGGFGGFIPKLIESLG